MLRQSLLNPSLRAGELVHSVTFYTPTATTDSSGQQVNTWSDYWTARAKVENLSGQQLYQADSFTSQAVWRITMHHPGTAATINVGDRAVYAAHTFVVQIADNVLERGRVLQLTCLEIDGTS